MSLGKRVLTLTAAGGAVGIAALLISSSASGQRADGPPVAATQNTVAEWNVTADEWSPPAPGRVAADWVFGTRFDLAEVVIWNPVKQRMIDGEDVIMTTIQIHDNEAYCELAAAGYHASWMEQQHRPLDIWQVADMWAACPPTFNEAGQQTNQIAMPGTRISETTETQIQRALDSGAMVLMVPTVDSYEEALEIVQWAYFPPLGKRSSGGGQAFSMYQGVPGGYRNSFNDNLVLVLMIETLWGVDDIQKIANIEGVTAIFAASGDLGNFSGYGPGDAPYEWLVAQIHDAAMDAGIRLCGPMAWHPARNPDRQDYTCFQGGRNAEADLAEQRVN
jgi:2-keto-3-deoxy-L-rhamnonate aldolase RhmA